MTEAPERHMAPISLQLHGIKALMNNPDYWAAVREKEYIRADIHKAEIARLQDTIVCLTRNALPEPGSEAEKAAVERMAAEIPQLWWTGCHGDLRFYMRAALRALREGGE